MNFDILQPKHILTLWLGMAIIIIAEILVQFSPYIHAYPKDQCELREFTLASFETVTQTRHSVKYSHFIDADGFIVSIRSSAKDHIGRKTKLYVYDSERALREKFELKYISLSDIVLILMFLMLSSLTIFYFMNWRKYNG